MAGAIAHRPTVLRQDHRLNSTEPLGLTSGPAKHRNLDVSTPLSINLCFHLHWNILRRSFIVMIRKTATADSCRSGRPVSLFSAAIVFVVLAVPQICLAQAQAEDPETDRASSSEAETPSLEELLAALVRDQHEEALEKADKALRQQTYYEIVGGFAFLVLTILGIIGYRTIKTSLEDKADEFFNSKGQEFTKTLKNDFTDRFDSLSSFIRERAERQVTNSLERAETFFLSYSQAKLMFQQEKYAEALRELGIDKSEEEDSIDRDGNVVDQLPRPARRLAIESLCRSRIHKKKLGFVAWESAKKLYQKTRQITDFALVLKLAVFLRRWDEGLEFHEIYGTSHQTDQKQEYEEFLFVLLRKLGHVERAMKLAEKYSDTEDVVFANNIAALYRDVGRFNQAHDLLYPHVARFMRIGSAAALPKGWHRVFNTFISNCIDRSRPADAVEEAKFVLSLRHDAFHVFSCLRLALNLSGDSRDRSFIIDEVRKLMPSLEPSDATIKIAALLTEIDGDPGGAVEQIDEQIRKAKDGKEKFIIDKFHQYYLACLQGEILIRAGLWKQAIDVLHTPAQEELGGEAKFLLAHAYACDANWAEATRWLSHAADETPKWAEKARDHVELRKVPGVQKLVAQYSSGTANQSNGQKARQSKNNHDGD